MSMNQDITPTLGDSICFIVSWIMNKQGVGVNVQLQIMLVLPERLLRTDNEERNLLRDITLLARDSIALCSRGCLDIELEYLSHHNVIVGCRYVVTYTRTRNSCK